MSCMDTTERNELVDMVAQAVIDKMDERDRISRLADMVVQRVIALQAEEAALSADANNTHDHEKENTNGTA